MHSKVFILTGSFDPITFGHLAILDQVVSQSVSSNEFFQIAISQNSQKQYMFSGQERVEVVREMIQASPFASLKNNLWKIDVVDLTGHSDDQPLCQHYANVAKDGQIIPVFVRGIRNALDFEYERKIDTFNRAGGVNSIFILAEEEFVNCSSSAIKQRIIAGEDFSTMQNLISQELYDKIKERV
jgi:pantetheine-phosphate adenylyltransferase